jgi:hypothetical protein
MDKEFIDHSVHGHSFLVDRAFVTILVASLPKCFTRIE